MAALPECASGDGVVSSARLNHVVFVVPPEQLSRAARMFSELGFALSPIDLPHLGLRVLLDWSRGLELVAPDTRVDSGPAQFLKSHGPGVYTVVLRVPDADAAEEVARRYGAVSRFEQRLHSDGLDLDEIDLTVMGFPLTLLTTSAP